MDPFRWVSLVDGKASVCNAGELDLIPGLGRSPGGGHGNPLQYSCLKNPHGQRSLVGCIHGVAELDMTERLSTAQHSLGGEWGEAGGEILLFVLSCPAPYLMFFKI